MRYCVTTCAAQKRVLCLKRVYLVTLPIDLSRRHRNKSGGRTGSYYGKYKKSKGGGGGGSDQQPMANGEGGGMQPHNIHHSQVVNKGTDQFFA